MPIGNSPRRKEPLYVWAMALALVAAAFAGAALGLVWDSASGLTAGGKAKAGEGDAS